MRAEQGDVRCKARRYHPYSHDYYIVCERSAGHEGEHHMDDCDWTDESKYALTLLEPVAEQGNVQPWREAEVLIRESLLDGTVGGDLSEVRYNRAIMALTALTAQIEELEREHPRCSRPSDAMGDVNRRLIEVFPEPDPPAPPEVSP